MTATAEVELRGRVETVFFASPRFSAGRLRTDDGERVSFAGALMVRAEDAVVLHGSFERHPKYGRQLKVRRFTFDQRLDADGLARFLANHEDALGVGPVKARRIADAFGEDFDRAIDEEPERVAAVARIPLAAARALRDAWLATRTLNAAMSWLASFDLTHHQVRSLVEKFGNAVVTVLKTDPYLLVREIPGFGFKRVDVVARKMGTPKDHPSRLRAGVLHCVAERLDQGDCWVEYEDLVSLANALLVLDNSDSRARIEAALDALIDEGALACASIGGRFLVARPAIFEMERDLATTFATRRAPNPHFAAEELDEAVAAEGGSLNAPQRRALAAALRENLVLVSGGAGSGKTYTVAAIARAYERRGKTVVLAAPTGKAAKRMEQVVGRDAMTLHRLLGFDGHAFAAGEDEPVEADVVIIDEVSMVDVPLAWNLLRAIDLERTCVVLVGDHNQLPPVGPGNLLRDLIERRPIETVVLDQVVRQAGVLKENSMAVLRGEVAPTAPAGADGRPPWVVANRFTVTLDAQRYVLQLFESALAERLHFDLLADVQLLTPTRKGPLGVDELNVLLQRLVQRKLRGVEVLPPPPGRRPEFLLGDRVLQTRNNYELGVMNGAIGVVRSVGPRRSDLVVRFDHGEVEYTAENEGAKDLSLAYALTIHKCVTGDTLIATDRGLRPIRDLAAGVAPGRIASASHRVAGRSGWATTDQVFAGGREPTIRVTTRAGFTVEGSHRHPVLVATEAGEYVWRRLPEVRAGDVLVLRRGVGAGAPVGAPMPEFAPATRGRRVGAPPAHVGSELGWLLGVLVGDGNQTDRADGRVEVTQSNRQFLARVAVAAVRLFGARPTVRRHGRSSSCYFHGRLIREFLSWAGLGFEKAGEKHVPWCVLTGPLEVQRAFLRGLFDTDGGVNGHVHFTTTSPRLAFEVQQLLLNNGIVASRACVREADPARGHAAAYRLTVTGDDVRLFRDAVGFTLERKTSRLLALRGEDEPAHGGKSNWGSAPHGQALARMLRDELRRRGGRNYPEARRVGALLSRVARGDSRLSVRHARIISAAVTDLRELGPAGTEVETIARDGLFFDPVVSIDAGEADVFDLHVPEGNAFVGNGFVNHNSQGSEFPCAVVVMHKAHTFMHHRNLFYTAVTRARHVAIVVGDAWGMRNCAQKEQVERRKTFLSVLDLPAREGG